MSHRTETLLGRRITNVSLSKLTAYSEFSMLTLQLAQLVFGVFASLTRIVLYVSCIHADNDKKDGWMTQRQARRAGRRGRVKDGKERLPFLCMDCAKLSNLK
jgi:hypothetical protein